MLSPVAHERTVAARFDELRDRFKSDVAPEDFRLSAVRRRLGPLALRRVLDLGCGKGRFASRLREEAADVVGVDVSRAMLETARDLERVRASARRLPFGDNTFDAVLAIEVFEHLPARALDDVLHEIRRVLCPGGLVAIIDKNAWSLSARRPWLPNLALKWLDERRGRWMYPAGGPVRERWFGPSRLRRRIDKFFTVSNVDFLISPDEARRGLFRLVPRARRMVLWSAAVPGGPAR